MKMQVATLYQRVFCSVCVCGGGGGGGNQSLFRFYCTPLRNV